MCPAGDYLCTRVHIGGLGSGWEQVWGGTAISNADGDGKQSQSSWVVFVVTVHSQVVLACSYVQLYNSSTLSLPQPCECREPATTCGSCCCCCCCCCCCRSWIAVSLVWRCAYVCYAAEHNTIATCYTMYVDYALRSVHTDHTVPVHDLCNLGQTDP